jgi:hypothetical protein
MSDINDNVTNIKENFDHFTADVKAFLDKGNKSAGTRARKELMDIGKLCKEIRRQIQDIKNESKA